MKLFYRTYGSGDPVIILHGLFGVSDNWTSFGRDISEHFKIYIPDLRNHGQSPHSPVFDIPSMVDDLMELIEDFEIRKPILIGHSLGGKVAMSFAVHYPEFVKKLVVVDISLRNYMNNHYQQSLLNAMLAVDFHSARSRSDVDRQLTAVVPDIRIRQFLLKNVYWRDRKTLDWRPNLKAININLPAILQEVESEGSYYGPSLFIRGSLSDYITNEDIKQIEIKFPGASVKTIDHAGHWVHVDNPGEFYSVVTEFLLL